MGKAERYSTILLIMKWLCFVPASIMYVATKDSFGDSMALILAMIFGMLFYAICSRGRMIIVSEEIVKDIKSVLKPFGHENSVYEVKGFSVGLVVRVYLIRAAQKTPACSKAIAETLSKGWYRQHLWMTQVVDVMQEAQISITQRELDDELLRDVKERDKRINKRSK